MSMTDYQHGWDGQSDEDMLSKMQAGWSGNTPCGRGSEFSATSYIRSLLPKICRERKWTTLADVGAGDLNWITSCEWASPRCIAMDHYDLVPRHKLVQEFDVTSDILPHAYDVVLVRHVLNHLSAKRAFDAISNLQASGSQWLLMTNCDNQRNYWREHGLYPLQEEPPPSWPDATKWQLELYPLQQIHLPRP